MWRGTCSTYLSDTTPAFPGLSYVVSVTIERFGSRDTMGSWATITWWLGFYSLFVPQQKYSWQHFLTLFSGSTGCQATAVIKAIRAVVSWGIRVLSLQTSLNVKSATGRCLQEWFILLSTSIRRDPRVRAGGDRGACLLVRQLLGHSDFHLAAALLPRESRPCSSQGPKVDLQEGPARHWW